MCDYVHRSHKFAMASLYSNITHRNFMVIMAAINSSVLSAYAAE